MRATTSGSTKSTGLRLLQEVKKLVRNMGDAELMNDYIFHNYSKAVSYFDDDLEKTSAFLD